MEKTMVIYQKLWNFDLLWKKLWYNKKTLDTIVNYNQLSFTVFFVLGIIFFFDFQDYISTFWRIVKYIFRTQC